MISYNSRYSSDLVAKYMSTLYYVNDDRNEMSVKYISEPILAEAAAKLMSKTDILNDVLTAPCS